MKKLLALVVLLASSAQAAPDPYVIQPGRGFGQFRATMSLAQIEKRLKPGEFGEGEADGKPDAEIYMLDPPKRVTLLLDAHKKIRSMFVHGYEGVWHTRDGIGLGTPLAWLEKLNGRAFRFRSFAMDERAGEIIDWGGGKLTRVLPRVTVFFATPMHASGYGSLSSAEKTQIEETGRVLLSSSPAARKLNPIIETIELHF